jgi:hypothetical protein
MNFCAVLSCHSSVIAPEARTRRVYLLVGVDALLQGRSRSLLVVSFAADFWSRFRVLGLTRETASCHFVSIVAVLINLLGF